MGVLVLIIVLSTAGSLLRYRPQDDLQWVARLTSFVFLWGGVALLVRGCARSLETDHDMLWTFLWLPSGLLGCAAPELVYQLCVDSWQERRSKLPVILIIFSAPLSALAMRLLLGGGVYVYERLH